MIHALEPSVSTAPLRQRFVLVNGVTLGAIACLGQDSDNRDSMPLWSLIAEISSSRGRREIENELVFASNHS